ncbi:DNA polymerase III subunit delta' C-terminal domain-containing protein [Buchnera aphidicola]|uniref:DNA polymerase III subunit delta' n=1 Tax=Buchnera aphidicola subsp. Rhopalosiphum maidis TaxID=118109 RepID=A0A3G2I5Y1_BUCRM|nr:DNA polymerase III subunit delta' C-terminal domain-containing protein [Buchnera aphidicola]AYN24715.1 DNA polymerase III subunit delta' [Buchnera aphidicola (Rhopalosiphum maidis)]
MKLYPWLLKPYKNIIELHQRKKAHHAILIQTQKGIGAFKLIWFISKWLLCLKPIGIKFCNNCHGCKLMSAKNHPDWHTIINEKNNTFDVDSIRIINEKIFKRAQQGNNKIIFLPNIHKLTESAVNALLKTLEEPPEKNWFFLIDYNYLKLNYTLKSRCFLYRLSPPIEKESLNWLKNENKRNDISNLTSLRINQGSPMHAKKFIEGELWEERKNLYTSLSNSIESKNLLKILPILCKNNTIIKIDWICLLLFDAIKINFNERKKLTNCDQLKLINFFSEKYNNIILNKSIKNWIKCRYILSSISSINNELLLLEQLLVWEKILHFFIKP